MSDNSQQQTGLYKITTGISKPRHVFVFRDGPLENLWGGGGLRSTKKIFAQGKIK